MPGRSFASHSTRSPSDVASFTTLHTSLRNQLPELNREGDKILNEEALAKLVDGVMRFQRDHLGRVSCLCIVCAVHVCLIISHSLQIANCAPCPL